jgi:hypothetical protein
MSLNLGKFLILVLFALGVQSCVSKTLWKQELEGFVQEENYRVSGRRILATKTLLLLPEIRKRHSERFPGEELKISEDKVHFWVGVSAAGREPLQKSEHRFFIDQDKCETVREETDVTKVEMQIPFAFPFYRVFHVKCPKIGNLKIETPVGSMVIWRTVST